MKELNCAECEHVSQSLQYCTKLTSLLCKPFELQDLKQVPKECPLK